MSEITRKSGMSEISNVDKLSNMDKLRRQTSTDLHGDADNVMDRLNANVIEAVPVQHRGIIGKLLLKLSKTLFNHLNLEDKLTRSSSWKNDIKIYMFASIRRMENLFEDAEDDRWFRIKSEIKRIVTDETSAYNLMKGIFKNALVTTDVSLKKFTNKFMMVLIMLARVLQRLDELDKLTVESVAKLVEFFMADVFAEIVQPMIELKLITMFLPALDDELKHSGALRNVIETINLGKILTFTAGLGFVEYQTLGTLGPLVNFGLMIYCYSDVNRKKKLKQNTDIINE